MTQTPAASAEITELTRRYLAVWNEADQSARRPAVESLWGRDGVEFVHEVQFRGHDELVTRVGGAYDAFVGTGKYTVTGGEDVTVHGDIVTFSARLTEPSGEAAWTARIFLLLDGDGRIREDYHVVVKPLPAT